jgi:hypothetical protein
VSIVLKPNQDIANDDEDISARELRRCFKEDVTVKCVTAATHPLIESNGVIATISTINEKEECGLQLKAMTTDYKSDRQDPVLVSTKLMNESKVVIEQDTIPHELKEHKWIVRKAIRMKPRYCEKTV